MTSKHTNRQKERGNVLFLILIAVALFAALSYVVTQSTRSGGGSTEREKNILSGAQMTQYPTALRTAIIRMVLSGVAAENIKFNAPASFGSISVNQLVFHPQGGGASFQMGPQELSATNNSQLPWFFNGSFYVPGIGMDTAGGNEIIAFLPGISQGICKQVNEELGVNLGACTPDVTGGEIPAANLAQASIEAQMIDNYVLPAAIQTPLACDGASAANNAFLRQSAGCFHTTTPSRYVFYSVLLER